MVRAAPIGERAPFLCLDNCNQEGRIVVGWLFIETGWAVGLIPNKDTRRKTGSSALVRTQLPTEALASVFSFRVAFTLLFLSKP